MMIACTPERSPDYYEQRTKARRFWVSHYRSKGCNERKAEELASRKMRKLFR